MLPPDHIAISNVRPAVEVSRRVGLDDGVLAALGLHSLDPEGVLGGSVAGATTYAHFEAVHAHLADDLAMARFQIAAARHHGHASLGQVGLGAKTAATLGDALALHGRFQHLTNRTAHYALEHTDRHVFVRESRPGPLRPGLLWVSDYALLVVVHLVRAASGVEPVRFVSRSDHSPEVREALQAFVGCEVVRGEAAVHLPRESLDAPLAQADPELVTHFHGELIRASERDPAEPELLTRIRAKIHEHLPNGPPSLQAVSRFLGMSPRTLQRRLRAHDRRFVDLVDDTRRRLALQHLADLTSTIAEAAWSLGYADESSFSRAFLRWTGTTPGRWREQPAPASRG